MTPTFSILSHHLIQSTAFSAVAIALAALLHRRSAATRHAILLAAAVKFALPLTWFVALGSLLHSLLPRPAVALLPAQALLLPSAAPPPSSHAIATQIPILLFTLWLAGAVSSLVLWSHRMLQPSPSQPNLDPADLATLDRTRHRIGLRRKLLLRHPGRQSRRYPCPPVPRLQGHRARRQILHLRPPPLFARLRRWLAFGQTRVPGLRRQVAAL